MGFETASAIIGVVAFSIEFIKILREVSAIGSKKKCINLQDSSFYLQKTAIALRASLISAPLAGLNDVDEVERLLALKCAEIAEDLANELDKYPAGTSKGEKFVTTIRLMFKGNSKIEDIESSLKTYENTLQTAMLQRLRYAKLFQITSIIPTSTTLQS